VTFHGYARAAKSLVALGSEDRQWLLSQLASDDRACVLEALQHLLAANDVEIQPATSSLTGDANMPASSRGQPVERTDHDIVEETEADALIPLLCEESDWLIATVLTQAEWPWADTFMESCSPARLERITIAMKTEAVALKPKVRQAVLSSLAHGLRQQPRAAQPLSSFEKILSRAEKKVSQAWSRDGETT